MFLPDATGKSVYPTQRSLHSGFHSNKYSDIAKEKAQRYLIDGSLKNWSPEMYKDKIIELVSPLKKGLESGEIKLNNAETLLEKFIRNNNGTK